MFLAKGSDRMLLKQNVPRKEFWRFSLVEVVALLLLPKSPFGQTLHRTTKNRMVEVKNQTIETDIAHNMEGNKTTDGKVPQVSKFLDQNLAPLSRKFPELIPEESLTNVHPVVKTWFTGKIPNLQLAGRLAHFSKNWKKLTQDQEVLSVVKGYVTPFSAKDYSKTGGNVQNTGIVNRSGDYSNAGQRSQKNVEHQFPDQFLRNI